MLSKSPPPLPRPKPTMATTTTAATSALVPSRRLHSRPPSPSSCPSLFWNRHSLFRRHRVCFSKSRLVDDSKDPQLRDLYGAVFGGQGLVEEEEEEEDEEDDDEMEESSIDLLVRFLGSLFRSVARRARKASRSILPAAIPPQLVSFAVDGVLLLASLSFAKALLEVFCTLGGSVFVVILLIRAIWATVSYLQSNGSNWSSGSYGTTQSG